jgi:hypothetical protein
MGLALSPQPAAAASVDQVHSALKRGQTAKAVRRAEEALATAPGEDTAELRYLLFKAHVLDLQFGKGNLFVPAVGKEPGGMERYEELLTGLEADVRGEGKDVLPFFVARLEDGDSLDRLLILGLLEDMLLETPDLPWGIAQEPASVSPLAAARGAVLAATGACVAREAAAASDSGDRPAGTDAERDDYFQDLYAINAGLSFLAGTDAAVGGQAAAAALECRGASGWVIEDRERLEHLGPSMVGPLRRILEAVPRTEVALDAALLLGRFGGCAERELLQVLADGEPGPARQAAELALQQIRLRLDC